MLITGGGVAVDRVPGDFIAGVVEQFVLDAAREHDWVFVEGQGSLVHPGYSGVSLALLHGCAPRAMVFCHQPSRTYIGEYAGDSSFAIPPLSRLIELYERAASFIRPARVTAIALNCFDLTDEETRAAITRTERETQISATDCVKYGAGVLMDTLETYVCKS
jgi:uncharacterized NAD-dependent epimerase/dehydratase family protein